MGSIGTNEAVKVPIKHKLHYAWVILIAACVLNIASRVSGSSFGVFVDPLVKLFGWSRGEVSLGYSLAFLMGLPAVIGVGWLGDRYGTRRLMLVASLVIATGTVLLGNITQLWQFYLFYGLFVGSLGRVAFTLLIPITITRWFHSKLGVAMGIYWASMGLGPLIFAPLFRWLIDTQGWRWTFSTMGIILGSMLILFSLLIRGHPREKGMTPYGAEHMSSDLPTPVASTTPRVGLRAVMAKPHVWYLTAIHHLGCVGHSIILAHVVSMATFQGVSGVTAAGILSTIAGASVVSRFLFSFFTERLGGRTLLTIAMITQSTPVLILLWAREPWAFYLFAVVFGLGYGGEMVGFPIINRQLFGIDAPLSSIYSFEVVGASTGMALGGWLGGMLFDVSGTYTWSILTSIVVGYLGLPFAIALPRRKRRVIPGTKAAGYV